MKLDYLREFLVLGDSLNYSAAAKKLFITQPSLSKHIARLEEELGVRLFVRDTHQVALTDAGKECLSEVRGIVEKYDDLIHRMEASNRGMSGTVRIGFLNYTMGEYVSPVIERIEELYPNMVIEPCPSGTNDIIENLMTGKVDIGLFMKVPLPQEDRFQFHHVYREKLAVFVGQGSPLRQFESVTMEQLQDESFLEIEGVYHKQYESAIQTFCMIHNFIPKHSVKVPNLEAAVLSVQRDKGIYILPRSAKAWSLPNVRAIDISDEDCFLYGCAAYRKDNENPALPLVIKEYDRLLNESIPF